MVGECCSVSGHSVTILTIDKHRVLDPVSSEVEYRTLDPCGQGFESPTSGLLDTVSKNDNNLFNNKTNKFLFILLLINY